MSFAIITGTPADGFQLIGPFPHIAIATAWAEVWEEDINWWVTSITNPSILEKERAL